MTAHSSEESAEQSLKLQKVLRGSYQNEKAGYCLEKAQINKDIADDEEKKLQETPEGNRQDEITEEIHYARRVAANYLRTAANCLDMKTARPPTPGQPEQTP